MGECFYWKEGVSAEAVLEGREVLDGFDFVYLLEKGKEACGMWDVYVCDGEPSLCMDLC